MNTQPPNPTPGDASFFGPNGDRISDLAVHNLKLLSLVLDRNDPTRAAETMEILPVTHKTTGRKALMILAKTDISRLPLAVRQQLPNKPDGNFAVPLAIIEPPDLNGESPPFDEWELAKVYGLVAEVHSVNPDKYKEN